MLKTRDGKITSVVFSILMVLAIREAYWNMLLLIIMLWFNWIFSIVIYADWVEWIKQKRLWEFKNGND